MKVTGSGSQWTRCGLQSMRILLQQTETGLYFKDVGSWSRDSSQAMDFASSTTAIDFCVTNKLTGIQLVLKFEEQKYDIVLPVATAQLGIGGRPGELEK